MSKLRVALIGAGQIAKVSHLPAYRDMEDVEIVGISDTNEAAAKQLADEFGVLYHSASHKELLAECRPDAVSVCVPNKFHYPIVMDALEAGSHVMCEKPPAITEEEAFRMAQKAEEEGLLLTYDFHFRHGKNIAIAKKKMEQHKFGEVYFTKVKWLRRAGVPGWGNFINKNMQGGGPLIDIGAHMLDLALYLLDYPEISYVTASSSNRIGTTKNEGLMGKWDNQKYTVEDGLFGAVYFKDGTCLQLETTFALNMKERDVRAVEIYGDQLGASLFPLEEYGGSDTGYVNKVYPYLTEEDLHKTALANFVSACMKKESLLVTAQQGAYIQQVVGMLYESAESGMPVIKK